MRFIDPPGGRPWALLGLCGASLLLNVVLVVGLAASSDDEQCEPAEVAEVVPAADQVAPAPAEVAPPPVQVPADLTVVHATVDHSLARSFQRADPERGDVLSAVYSRLFWWDLDLRSDLQKGDEIRLAYEWDGELAHVVAASYHSKKLGQTLTAYRFQATGDAYPSWWDESGTEVPRRIVDCPLYEYEQITALVNTRHRHHGIDFKAPVGTPVHSPKAGTVVRTDWNWKYNGNGVEVRYRDGTLARFLHLSETGVAAGQGVAAGERIGATGNTGRSTAPHLHYELEKGERVVDPVEYHGVERRSLPAADLPAFQLERDQLEAVLGSAA